MTFTISFEKWPVNFLLWSQIEIKEKCHNEQISVLKWQINNYFLGQQMNLKEKK